MCFPAAAFKNDKRCFFVQTQDEEAAPGHGRGRGRRSGHHVGPVGPRRTGAGGHLLPREHAPGKRSQEHTAGPASLQETGCRFYSDLF